MPTATKKNSILLAWSQTVARRSGDPAIFTPAGGVERRFSEIEQESLDLGRDLSQFAPGNVVGIQIGNSARWPALLIAAFRQGLIPLPLGRHIEKHELDLILAGAGAIALVDTDKEGLLRFSPVEAGAGPPAGCDFLKLTSGTTSAPRMIRFHADQLLADCVNICATMDISDQDLNFGAIPFSHSYGFSNLITPLICRGVSLVASDDRMPRAILDGLAATRATVFPGMPVFFDKFAGMKGIPPLPSLRLCISAGAPLSKAVAEQFSGRFGVKIHSFYGASECGGICYDASEGLNYEEGFLGRPLANVAIEPGGDGTICVRSAAVGEGYYPAPDPGTLGEGRFIPGDLLAQADCGMTLVGRLSDFINVAGRKLNPLEVEAQLLAFPGITQAVVFGVPSPLRNEMPVACIAGCADRAALYQFAHARLSSWQMPKDFWFVEEIPANERGKISRRDLAERYNQRRKNDKQ